MFKLKGLRLKVIVLTIAVIFWFSQDRLSAQKQEHNLPPNIPQLEPITKEDRILIMAPHPDDEALGMAGIIQKAVKAGAEIRVLYLTNGEHNQLAFIVYEKRFVIKQKALIAMGELRRQEAISAMKFLGVPEDKLMFLGYPDFGTLAIFMRYWGDSRPFKNMLTKISHVPYKEALTPNAPYKGESILWDIESVLRKYKPTIVFVTNPVDTNRDHRAFYLFLQVALWNLNGRIPQPKVYPYLIHCYNWPLPRNYHSGLYLDVPQNLKNSQIGWRLSELSDTEVEQKYNAICIYKSQCSDSAFYLKSFARKNELFGDYPIIKLDKQKQNEDFGIAVTFKDRTVAYAKVEDDLLINIFLKKEGDKLRRLYINLISYSPDVEFSKMPKLKISISEDNIKVLNYGKFTRLERMEVDQKPHAITVKVSLKELNSPKYILSSVNTYAENFASDLNAWRIIEIS